MNISFILVNPAVPENIGASARAIKTMGFSDLLLVNPPDDYIGKARILAHGSADLLENAAIHPSFESAVSGYDLLIATTSKKRRSNEEYVQADRLPELILSQKATLGRMAVIFGSEESGLSNREIKQCDIVSFIPIIKPYPSLNLSHAVMIYAYLLSGLTKSTKRPKPVQQPGLKVLKEKVERIMTDINLKQPHIIGPRIMEKISLLNDGDISLLHSICNAYLDEHGVNPDITTGDSPPADDRAIK